MLKVQASKSQVLLRDGASPRDNGFCYSFLWDESAWGRGEKRDIFIVYEPLRDRRRKFWRRKWQPTPVFLLGESQGWRNLVGCHLWGRTELDTTEVTQQQVYLFRKFQTRSAYIVAVFFSYLIFIYFNAVRKLTENFHFYQNLVLSKIPYRIRE